LVDCSVPAIAVPAFALTWWLACYLIGRDPARPALRGRPRRWRRTRRGRGLDDRAGFGAAAEICSACRRCSGPAPRSACCRGAVPERRQIDRGWLVLSAPFLLMASALPPAGRLVALAPLAAAWCCSGGSATRCAGLLPAALTVVAACTRRPGRAAAPIDLGAPGLVLAAIGLDLLVLGFLVAVADAVDAGERLRPDLRRSLVAAVAARCWSAARPALTMLAAPGLAAVVLQFVLVGGVMTGSGWPGRCAGAGPDRVPARRAAAETARRCCCSPTRCPGGGSGTG
jgi:hypothetical protein